MNLADSYMSALKLIVRLRAALRELYDESPHLAEGNLSERIDQLLGYQSLAHEEVNTPKTELMSQTDSMQEFAPGPDGHDADDPCMQNTTPGERSGISPSAEARIRPNIGCSTVDGEVKS